VHKVTSPNDLGHVAEHHVHLALEHQNKLLLVGW
jgi:hypothetical protein